METLQENKVYISKDLGCAYRLNGGLIEFAPMMQDGTFDISEFGYVELDLVGEETVNLHNGEDVNLYEYIRRVKMVLKGQAKSVYL